MLFSLLMAAASRSGQSERLTNSNCASAMSSIACEGPGLRFDAEETGRGRSNGFTSSFDGVGIDSLNKSKDAATLRPIPALGRAATRAEPGEPGDEDEEGEGDRRDRGRVANGGDIVSRGSEVDIRDVGNANVFSDACRTARRRDLD